MMQDLRRQTALVDSVREIGAIVRTARNNLNMTQDELAKKSGVSRRTVIDIESGKETCQFSVVAKVCFAADLEFTIRTYRPN